MKKEKETEEGGGGGGGEREGELQTDADDGALNKVSNFIIVTLHLIFVQYLEIKFDTLM